MNHVLSSLLQLQVLNENSFRVASLGAIVSHYKCVTEKV